MEKSIWNQRDTKEKVKTIYHGCRTTVEASDLNSSVLQKGATFLFQSARVRYVIFINCKQHTNFNTVDKTAARLIRVSKRKATSF